MHASMWRLMAVVFFFAKNIMSLPTSMPSIEILPKSPEALAQRQYFYVGGHYVDDGTGNHTLVDQMYVEQLIPHGGGKHQEAIVFMHGQAQTGTNWLNTPDGRQGWASWFLERRYVVYIVDQPERGRSAYMPGDGSLSTYSAEYVSKYFTAVQGFDIWPQARFHTQWPGSGLRGDPIFDAFYASQVQFQSNATIVQIANQNAGAALFDRIGPSILITHSEAGSLGFLIADARPSLVKALISLEPSGPPFVNRIIGNTTGITKPYGLTAIPITYSPPVVNAAVDLHHIDVAPAEADLSDCMLQAEPPRKLVNLAKMPHLVVTSEASYHAVYDYCTVRYLEQGGVNVEYLVLPEAGFHGNAHLFFMEKNNLAIAGSVEEWIQRLPESTRDAERGGQ